MSERIILRADTEGRRITTPEEARVALSRRAALVAVRPAAVEELPDRYVVSQETVVSRPAFVIRDGENDRIETVIFKTIPDAATIAQRTARELNEENEAR